jgi:hypothetical protein
MHASSREGIRLWGLKRAGAVREAHFLTPTNQFPLKLGRKSTTGGPLRL